MRRSAGSSESSYDWMKFARADLATARMTPPPDGIYEPLCFHAQQAAEKSLKAVLVHNEIEFPYTHNLKILVDLLPQEVTRDVVVLDAVLLTDYAISTRYPGSEEPILEEDYHEAVRLAAGVVAWATQYLGLDETG